MTEELTVGIGEPFDVGDREVPSTPSKRDGGGRKSGRTRNGKRGEQGARGNGRRGGTALADRRAAEDVAVERERVLRDLLYGMREMQVGNFTVRLATDGRVRR